jgi:hypothetical protein
MFHDIDIREFNINTDKINIQSLSNKSIDNSNKIGTIVNKVVMSYTFLHH